MTGRILTIALSLAVLGGSAYASWYGWGTISRDTGAGSVRTGSAIVGGPGRVRVK
ncbi:MAG: hypothetical protein AAF919_03730 [Pseudomonadota bacterium]